MCEHAIDELVLKAPTEAYPLAWDLDLQECDTQSCLFQCH